MKRSVLFGSVMVSVKQLVFLVGEGDGRVTTVRDSERETAARGGEREMRRRKAERAEREREGKVEGSAVCV